MKPAAVAESLRARLTDPWCVAILAACLSIGFFAWYDAHGVTTAFNDARIREMIARRVLVSRTPGLAQLGTTWLPLPFMAMLPLIWNGTLFRDGIAGSLPAMVSFVIAAVYMYRLARLLTGSRAGGWIAALAVMLNGSLLYMQSTPMSETPSLTAFVVAIYYGARAARTYEAADVMKCAAAVAAGTLIRYENWVLAITLAPVLVYAAWRHRGRALAESWTILYALLAFAGCVAWVIYNWVIFHDPLLSFYYGQSSHTFYANTPSYMLPARGHAGFALVMYALTVAGTVGWPTLVLGVAGLGIYLWRARAREGALPLYLLLVPLGFYWLALYHGANTESLPQLGEGQYYNIRFGLAMIPGIAIFAAFLAAVPVHRWLRAAVAALVVAVLAGSFFAESVQHTPFVLREALYGSGSDGRRVGQTQADWLGAHYRGGNVLITYVNSPSLMFYLLTEHHLSDRALITDANGPQFTRALSDPPANVAWIVMDSNATNGESRIWTVLHKRTDWRRRFVLKKTFGTTQIYERLPASGARGGGTEVAAASSPIAR